MLLDEATVGADVETRAALIDVVRGIASRGSAVLYSTHYLGEIEALDPRVVIVDQGQVITEGSVGQLIAANGGGVIELRFEGDPPPLGPSFEMTVSDDVLRVEAADPGADLPRVLSAIGSEVSRLRGVEVINPSLETVFLALTGRRYIEDEEGDRVVAP